MNKLYFTSIFSIFLFASTAYANPEGEVYKAISKIKASGNLSTVVEMIDWDSNYKQLSPEEREARGFKNSEQMMKHYKAEAETYGKKELEEFREGNKKRDKHFLSEEEKARVEAESRTVENAAKSKEQEMKKLISQTKYKVLGSEVDGETAKVKVLKLREGSSEEVELDLKKVDGTWKLLSAGPLNPLSMGNSKGAPLGVMDGPTQAIALP